MARFPAAVVTPERTLVEAEVEEVSVRTVEGEAAYLAGHSPLIGALVPGPVRLRDADGERTVAVHGGLVQVDGGRVVVLAPVAELAEEIDLERARRALEAAEGRLAELGDRVGGDEEETTDRRVTEARGQRERATVRIEVGGG